MRRVLGIVGVAGERRYLVGFEVDELPGVPDGGAVDHLGAGGLRMSPCSRLVRARGVDAPPGRFELSGRPDDPTALHHLRTAVPRQRRCPAHKIRNGSTRSWRSIRAGILARDQHRGQLCGQPANEVDHVIPLAQGGSDVEGNLRALCHGCHVAR